MYLLRTLIWERIIWSYDLLCWTGRTVSLYHSANSLFSPKYQQTTRQKKELHWQKKVYRGSWDMSGCKNSSKHFYLETQCIFWLNWIKTSQLTSFLDYHTTTYTTRFCLFFFLLLFSLQDREGIEQHSLFFFPYLFSQK